MKKLTALFIGLIILCNVWSQHAFTDAVKLKSFVKPDGTFSQNEDTLKEIAGILGLYLFEKLPPGSSVPSVLEAYDNKQSPDYNPFLAPFITNNKGKANSIAPRNLRTDISPFTGGINVPVIADGVAKFLVERFKEEMTINFFNKFKEILNDPEYEELRIMFPNTYETLNAIDKDIYQFSLYMDMLRDAFEKDLRAIPVNLFKVMRGDKFQALLDDEPILKGILNIGVDVAEGIMNKEHPGKIIENLNVDNVIEFDEINVTSTVVFFKEMSLSFKSDSTEKYWVDPDFVKDNIKDTTLLKLYLGLLYQRERIECKSINSRYEGDPVVYNLMDTIGHKRFEAYIRTFQSFINISNSIETIIQKIKDDKGEEIDYLDIYDYFTYTIQIIEECVNIYEEVFNKEAPRELNLSIYTAKTTSQVYLDANERNYVSAVVNSIALVDTLFQSTYMDKYYLKNKLDDTSLDQLKKNYHAKYKNQVHDIERINKDNRGKIKSSKKEMKAFIRAIQDKALQKKVENLYMYYKLTRLDNFLSAFLKYGNFAASIAQAKTSDEVKEIIKATVLPPGSSGAKTYSSFSIALNGYVGISTGHEFHDQSREAFNSFAIWAPVGVSFNIGLNNKWVGTIGVNLTIVDIGALVSFRFDDDSTDVLPQFNAQNLLAPGAYFTVGRIFNTPITLGFGGQYGPQLRTISSTGADITGGNWRLNVTLSCDIPFFYLYRKPKNISLRR